MSDKEYRNATCRGSYFFGTACGHCERCMDEIRNMDIRAEKTSELEVLKKKIKDLEAKLEIAKETLEFYAHGDNWGHIEPGTHYVTNIYQCVDKTDYGEGDFTISERMNI